MNFKEKANLVCILRITKFMQMFVITKDSNSKISKAKKLEKAAHNLHRGKNWLISEAVRRYLDLWFSVAWAFSGAAITSINCGNNLQ
jgi:hypothetical protein